MRSASSRRGCSWRPTSTAIPADWAGTDLAKVKERAIAEPGWAAADTLHRSVEFRRVRDQQETWGIQLPLTLLLLSAQDTTYDHDAGGGQGADDRGAAVDSVGDLITWFLEDTASRGERRTSVVVGFADEAAIWERALA